jgi:hypothetical protein
MISFDMDSMFERSKMIYEYCTKSCKYNHFVIDEVDEETVKALGKAIREGNRVQAVRLYLKLDKEIDELRAKYCFNVLPYRSCFRAIAKDLYRELKRSWLRYSEDFGYVAYVLKNISTSDYYTIREFLMKRSDTMFWYKDIPIDPDSFYCGYIPLEAFLYYAITLYKAYCIRR